MTAVARVVVTATYPHKLRNGSVLVLEPGPEPQLVKREVADGLVRSGRGRLHDTDLNFPPETKGTD